MMATTGGHRVVPPTVPGAGQAGIGRPLDWDRDGADWPLRRHSRFVTAGGLRWHVQVLGRGPCLLLVHGTGAASHSWRGLGPLLADRFTIVIPDLPGHGFTEQPPAAGLSLPGMAAGLRDLLAVLRQMPDLVVGHSAGAAILTRMCLDGSLAPRALVSLNGALLPLRGVAGQLFSPLARLVAASNVVPRLFAWRVASDRAVIERMLDATGSRIDPLGGELYRRLAGRSGHVAAALGMMANWDLEPLRRELGRLRPPLILLVGTNDRTIRPAEARRVQALLPATRLVALPGLGHLAHEEQPEAVAALLERIALDPAGVGSPACLAPGCPAP